MKTRTGPPRGDGQKRRTKKKKLGGYETDKVILMRRDEQISDIKKSDVYRTYRKAVPRKARLKGVHPQTPDSAQICRLKMFNDQIEEWRSAILNWNQLKNSEEMICSTSDEMICSTSEAASEDLLCAGTPTKVEKVESDGGFEWKSGDDESDTEFAQSASFTRWSTERKGRSDGNDRSDKRKARWQIELKRRKWEINCTKALHAYKNYIKAVPRYTRQEGVHPQTPDITIKGKRSKWSELTKLWCQAVKKFHYIKEDVDEIKVIKEDVDEIKVMRENHINRVKKSAEYQRYRRAVRRDARQEGVDPQTPDTSKKYDRKHWARQLSKWYQALCDWDPDKKETDSKKPMGEEIIKTMKSDAYKRYISEVPRRLRQEGIDPQTPDLSKRCDPGDWKILVERWRIALSEWDTPNQEQVYIQAFLEEMNRSSSEDASEDFHFAGTSTKVKEVESEGGFAWESGDDESDTKLAVSAPPTSWSPERKRRSDGNFRLNEEETIFDGSEKPSKSCDQRPDISNIRQDQRRDGQISDVKKSAVYQTYIKAVPRHARREGVHPQTPDRSKKYSQIQSDREITRWRTAIIKCNELEKIADELQLQARSAPPTTWSQERPWRSDGNFTPRNDEKVTTYHGLQQGAGRHARREGVHPQTPDRYKKYSQIEFDREITHWRTAIIKFNELEKKADELQARSASPTNWSQENEWRSDENFIPRNDEKEATYHGLQQGPGRSAPPTNWSQEREWRSDGNFTPRNIEKEATYHGLQQGPASSAPLTNWSQERPWQSDGNFRPRNDEKVTTYPGLQQGAGSSAPPTTWSQERPWQSDGNFTPRNDEKVTTYHGLQQGLGRYPSFYFNPNVS